VYVSLKHLESIQDKNSSGTGNRYFENILESNWVNMLCRWKPPSFQTIIVQVVLGSGGTVNELTNVNEGEVGDNTGKVTDMCFLGDYSLLQCMLQMPCQKNSNRIRGAGPRNCFMKRHHTDFVSSVLRNKDKLRRAKSHMTFIFYKIWINIMPPRFHTICSSLMEQTS
jgi:hypothetical protein